MGVHRERFAKAGAVTAPDNPRFEKRDRRHKFLTDAEKLNIATSVTVLERMMDIWDRLNSRRFRPAEVGIITNHSTVSQRKWAERYFDFGDTNFHLAVYEEKGVQRRFSWAGVQMMAVFGDVMADFGNGDIAQKALMLLPNGEGKSSNTLWHHDLRDRPNGDLFMIYFLDRPEDPKFSTTGLDSLPTLIGDHWGNRPYLYNISAMQRRLVELAMRIDPFRPQRSPSADNSE